MVSQLDYLNVQEERSAIQIIHFFFFLHKNGKIVFYLKKKKLKKIKFQLNYYFT